MQTVKALRDQQHSGRELPVDTSVTLDAENELCQVRQFGIIQQVDQQGNLIGQLDIEIVIKSEWPHTMLITKNITHVNIPELNQKQFFIHENKSQTTVEHIEAPQHIYIKWFIGLNEFFFTTLWS